MSISETTASPVRGSSVHDATQVFRGLVAALIALLVVTAVALAGVAFYAAEQFDQRDQEREKALVASALQAEQSTLGVLTMDRAWWDAAVRNLVEVPDLTWADDNIGWYMAQTYQIGFSSVVDAVGNPGITYLNGGLLDDASDLEDTERAMLRRLAMGANRAPVVAPSAVTEFAVLQGEIYVLAAAPLTPENPTAEDLRGMRRSVLILARPLSGTFQKTVSDRLLLEGVDIAHTHAEAVDPNLLGSIGIQAADGRTIGHVLWRPDESAGMFRDELAITVVIAIVVLSLLGGLIAAYLLRTRRMASATSLALLEERRLLESKSHLLTTIAHELKTPLTAMQAAVDLLAHFGGRMSEDDKREELDLIRDRIQLMDRVISDAVAMERGDGSRFKPRAVDPAETVRMLWRRQRPPGDRALEVTDIREDRSSEQLDFSLFERAVGNVLSNALKFGHPATPVRVRMERVTTHLHVEVQNKGPDIPADQLGRVTESFYRGSNAGTVEGQGLGLSIALGAVEQHGGSLEIKSMQDGQTSVMLSFAVGNVVAELPV